MTSEKDKLKELLSQDSRRSERLTLPMYLFYSHLPETAWIGPQSVVDVGGDGLRFQSEHSIAENSELQLKINLSKDPTPLIFKCKVVRCEKYLNQKPLPTAKNEDGYSIGVKFYKMAHTDRQKYVNFICGKILSSYLTEEDSVDGK
ncbi:MAG: PilZ domain-containing protein [Planctomycetes bacterium]|nr:PilZ domain-containing protein [Planctomycetota bacterium]